MFYLYLGIFILLAWYFRKVFNGPFYNKPKHDLGFQHIIVTGSSAGIGKETALDLLNQGADVIFACRDEAKTKAVIKDSIKDSKVRSRAHFIKLDLTNVDSIISFNKEVRKFLGENDVDMLINNAGLMVDEFKLSEGIESTLMSNHIGHKILTHLLLDKMNPHGARIINVSSYAHNFSNYTVEELKTLQTDLDFKGVKEKYTLSYSFTQYGNSKLANILFTKYLEEKLKKNYPFIKVCSLHPGTVNTEFSRIFNNYNFIIRFLWNILYPLYWYFSKSQIAGAQTTLTFCYDDFETLENGVYLQDNRKGELSALAKDPNVLEEFTKYSWMLVDKVTKGKIEVKAL